jgi:bifunctional UDP-N-acetylglucosamine pyrophosphorylase/glucosamine-1-phosphate N-acetyltransferase
MQDPDTIYLWHDTKIAAKTHLEPNIFFGPEVTIEEGVTVKAFSHIEGAYVKSGAVIGPFARLRPGTVLQEDVRIGNFVEVKNATLGKGSKANHLGYIGDATLGENVNFSCGAITVNYDGFEKHQTTIGDNVMVGSNASLIAPITIGDGAFVAAGSTLTEDVPADALALTRPEAQIRKGWAAKYREIKAAIKEKKQRKKSA